jgi:hypothetical protein
MGIDFVVDLACPVKKAIPTEQLVDLLKKRGQANFVISSAKAAGNNLPLSEIKFVSSKYTPEKTEEKSVSVQDFLDEAAVLDQYETYCSECPVNVHNKPFGCVGYIPYPITASIEEWLLTLLPDNLESVDGQMFCDAIKDFNYTGEPVDDLRADKTFFESDNALKRTWPRKGRLLSLLPGYQVTSSQIWEMIFHVGAIQPGHSFLLAIFLGIIPHNCDPGALLDPTEVKGLVHIPELPNPDAAFQHYSMIGMLRAIGAALIDDLYILIG